MASQPVSTEALELKKPQATVNPNDNAMISLIERAVSSPEFDVTKLKELLDVRERWEKNEARKAFVEAMTAFKAHAIRVERDKVNTQYNSRYVSLGNLVATVTPYLSQHGLSAQWDIDQTNGIKVSCVVRHTRGHSESVAMVVPPDISGSKNPIQQIKSAITYAKACTFESICGLASSEANLDDDGNAAGSGSGINADELCEFLMNAKDVPELQKLFTKYYAEAKGAKDVSAQKALIKAKDRRKQELLRTE